MLSKNSIVNIGLYFLMSLTCCYSLASSSYYTDNSKQLLNDLQATVNQAHHLLNDFQKNIEYARKQANAERALPEPIFALSNSVYLRFLLGVGLTQLTESQNVPLAPDLINRYVATSSNRVLPLVGAGLGYEYPLKTAGIMSFELAGYYLSFGKVRGTVYPAYNISPNFDTLNFSYQVSSGLLWGEFYWYFTQRPWRPYLFLGGGAAWNQASSYSEAASNPYLSAAPMLIPFSSNTKANFSYGVGIGINHLLKSKPVISLEYRYMNLNTAQLGQTPPQTTTQQLTSGTLYANLIIFSILLK